MYRACDDNLRVQENVWINALFSLRCFDIGLSGIQTFSLRLHFFWQKQKLNLDK